MICKKPNTQRKTMMYTVTKKWARELTYFSKLLYTVDERRVMMKV